MKTLLRLLLKSQHQRNRSHPTQTEKGMTLVELLVGSIMAFLIITPMLAFVVDMLNTDRREQVKANTEQDIQAAVDFIGQDLNQAIYIYDNDGITALNDGNFIPKKAGQTPILVFWKRQIQPKALPVIPTAEDAPNPTDCDKATTPCNDAYVLSLVAYYQIKETDPKSIWCQPSGGTCPTRIARYKIREGIKDPKAKDSAKDPYYKTVEPGQEPSDAYNPGFDLSKPLVAVTNTKAWDSEEVLVNDIDYSPKAIDSEECKKALGNPTDPKDNTKFLNETTLRIPNSDNINSFYACVDTAKNTARVTIRGNSLRRIQPNDAAYDDKKSAFFPTASIQVQGLGARGK